MMDANSGLSPLWHIVRLLLILVIANLPVYCQTPQVADDGYVVRKLSLVSELQSLFVRTKRLDTPVAEAAAEAEIADAAWAHDREWAETLLREAYQLTFPEDDDGAKVQRIPAGAHHQIPGSLENARLAVRRRILQVASRDAKFSAELVKLGITQLGAFEGHVEYASLARQALTDNDKESASNYILRAIESDPTQMGAVSAIQELAARDRAAADAVILQYIQMLSATPLAFNNGSIERVTMALGMLIYPTSRTTGAPMQAPGPAVMRAYVIYVLNSIVQLEQQYPGSLSTSRILLLHTYPLLRQYAPELTPQFLSLEQQSRRQGESFSLPTAKSMEQEYRAKYDKGVDREVDSDHPDETVIRLAIGRQDFSKARKMIDKLADGPQKIELLDMLNTGQAISLANKEDIPGARKLAESLVKAASILRVFPVIAAKCAATNVCARDTINQAVKQLKKADVTPFAPPPGVPASIMGTSKDFDPVLSSLGGLASAVISVKDELALDVLDELVIAANHSELDTGLGRTGFETSLFKKLAEQNEARVNLAAMQLKDPLRQIVALAAIDQWKSDKLTTEAKLRNVKNESTSKKN